MGTPKWYEKLGSGLTTNITGLSSFYDSLFNFKSLIDTFQWGAHHSIPITLALPPLGIFQIRQASAFRKTGISQKHTYSWNYMQIPNNSTIFRKDFLRRIVSPLVSALALPFSEPLISSVIIARLLV